MEVAVYLVTSFAALAGIVVGAILGLNGFAQPATGGIIGQSPRIKNLVWLFSGLFPVFVADFGKLGVPKDFPWYWPFSGYGFGALLGAVGAVGWMVRSITITIRTFNQEHPLAPHVDPAELQREYLTYGKTRYDERWEKQRQDALKAEEVAKAVETRRRLDLEADKLMARCVYGALGHLALSEAQRRSSEGALIDTIMEAILSVVRVHSDGNVLLRGSYMTYIPAQAADHHLLRARARFTNDMPDRYIGYLELRRGGGRQVRDVVLPVAEDPNCVLPGAPEAVAVMGVAIMNLSQIGFQPGVSKTVQEEGKEYFRAPYFEPISSVTSIVIQDGGAVHGVMNIESSSPDLLGKGEEEAQAVLARLQTLVALLSIFR